MIAEKIPVEEEPKVTTNDKIPGYKVTSYKGYYHGIYLILHLKKEVDADRKEEQLDV